MARYVPNRAGMTEMMNMGGIQQACLGVARDIAAGVSGVAAESGFAMSTDVRAGKRRCHARATATVPATPRPAGYYRNLWHGETVALALQAGVLGYPSGTLGELGAVQLRTRKDKKTGERKYVKSRKEKYKGKGHIATKKPRKSRKRKK